MSTVDWFLLIIAAVLLLHVIVAALLWKAGRSTCGAEDRSLMRGVLIRFIVVPTALIAALVLTALWVPQPEDAVAWVLVAALVAYLVYLTLSAIYFGLRLVQEHYGR